MEAVLGQKLTDGCVIHFLTLGADSSFVAQRAIEEKREEQDICNDVATIFFHFFFQGMLISCALVL